MQTATDPLTDGIFEELFPHGRLVSAFVDLTELDITHKAHPDLSPAERDLMSRLGVEKRRRDWLGGRLAAKRAVIRLAELGGLDWLPTSLRDVEVLPSHTREPIVSSSEAHLPVQVQVSISHSGRFAGAVACAGDHWRLGFDLERAEAIDPALYQLAFRDFEIREIETAPPALRPIAVLVLWTAKEAISKAIGTGLSVCLQDIELTFPDGFLCEDFSSRRFGACLRNGGPRLTVHTCRRGDYVLSLAWTYQQRDVWEGSQSR